MVPYASARSRAQVVDALLAAQLALWTLQALGAVWTAVAPDGALAVMFARGARLAQPFLLVLFIGAAIALLLWLDRAARNLPALHVRKPIAPEHVVGVFFAPFVNVVAIPFVVFRVWLTSDRTAPRRRWLLLLWWTSFLMGVLLLASTPFSSALMAASAASLIAIVRDTQRRQDAKFEDDELRAAVPVPTGELLR